MHRGGESSLDISADLTELGRTPVAVVCAGVKSVLDIPRTLEYLETQVRQCTAAHCSTVYCPRGCTMLLAGQWLRRRQHAAVFFCVHGGSPLGKEALIPQCWPKLCPLTSWPASLSRPPACAARLQGVCVAAYGADEVPAFFTPHSGCKAPCRVDAPAQAAAMVAAARRLQLGGGMVLGVPIPAEHAAAGAQVEGAIAQALEEADQQGVRGNEITPFLLQRIQELTGGKSLEANIKLVKNNAAVGAQVAAALAAMR